ncbi:MAG: penicillin acylase family protein [Myxococcota bacterium]
MAAGRIARDRFVMMDVIRRAGRGRLAPLLGDLALPRDMEARGTGVTYVGEVVLCASTPPSSPRAGLHRRHQRLHRGGEGQHQCRPSTSSWVRSSARPRRPI